MAEIGAAIDESLLDQFTLKVHQSSHFETAGGILSGTFEGKIQGKNAEKIFIEIFNEKLKTICADETFDIRFYLNRVPFQLQHFALDFLREQSLFNVLIDNPAYDDVSCLSTIGDSAIGEPEIFIG